MTAFYGLPGSGAFWHWPTLLHFILVALAGGTAFVTALLTFREDKTARRYAWVATGLDCAGPACPLGRVERTFSLYAPVVVFEFQTRSGDVVGGVGLGRLGSS